MKNFFYVSTPIVFQLFLSPFSDVSASPSKIRIDKNLDEIDIYGPPYDKKWVGDIFAGGIHNYKRIGSVLGRGFALGKRLKDGVEPEGQMFKKQGFGPNPETEAEFYTIGSEISANNEDVGERVGQDENSMTSKEDGLTNYFKGNGPIRGLLEMNKRFFGHRLGNGFALGKRNKRSLQDGEIDEYAHGGQLSVYEDNPADYINEKRFFDSDMGGRFGKRFGEMLDTEPIDDELSVSNRVLLLKQLNKRYFDSDPGYRFRFGKRSNWKRYFGHVLGRGFRLGKRGGDTDVDEVTNNMDEDDIKKRYGNLLRGSYWFSKRDMDYPAQGNGIYFVSPIEVNPEIDDSIGPYYQDGYRMEKRYGNILGRGFKFGRPIKRYGWVLGRGFRLGKRAGSTGDPRFEESLAKESKALDDEENMKKQFGHGYEDNDFNLGSSEDYSNTPYKRLMIGQHFKRMPFGHVLGNGFAFGKRNYENEHSTEHDNDKRAFGHWFGSGFKLGKRSDEYTDNEYNKFRH